MGSDEVSVDEEVTEKLEGLVKKVHNGELEREYLNYFLFHHLGKRGVEFYEAIELMEETSENVDLEEE